LIGIGAPTFDLLLCHASYDMLLLTFVIGGIGKVMAIERNILSDLLLTLLDPDGSNGVGRLRSG